MLKIEQLQAFGANTAEGLSRCLGNADFYLRLVSMACAEESFTRLEQAVAEGDLQRAFDAAHSLKGVLGNLALTPLYEPVVEITELLRTRAEADYGALVRALLQKRDELHDLCI